MEVESKDLLLKPAIVVACYNRPRSLERILKSISAASFERNDIELVISIDKSDNNDVIETARKFNWIYGNKTIIERPKNLGLKNHILKCGELTKTYGSIILLEDDLYVSKYFYHYSINALNYYGDDNKIAGISLYSPEYNESSFMRFRPLSTKKDVYFMQVPSSWGQAWTKKQWESFENWYSTNDDKITSKDSVPANVVLWPETSWKKYFFKYIIEMDLYFVYPYMSLTTNFADVGVNHNDNRTTIQVPIDIKKREYVFCSFKEAELVYDSFLEITKKSINEFLPDISKFDVELDLYGCKSAEKIQSEYVLTSKDIKGKPLMSFGRCLKPHELNIIEKIPGDIFKLVKKEQVVEPTEFELYDVDRNSYYYNIRNMFLVGNDFRAQYQNVFQMSYELKYFKRQKISFALLKWFCYYECQIRKVFKKLSQKKRPR